MGHNCKPISTRISEKLKFTNTLVVSLSTVNRDWSLQFVESLYNLFCQPELTKSKDLIEILAIIEEEIKEINSFHEVIKMKLTPKGITKKLFLPIHYRSSKI